MQQGVHVGAWEVAVEEGELLKEVVVAVVVALCEEAGVVVEVHNIPEFAIFPLSHPHLEQNQVGLQTMYRSLQDTGRD